ncbi:MAG TPA: MFS transporter [Polyangiaceae bacterium]|nr:MFS transporter [Polyangiaceae bacterium]
MRRLRVFALTWLSYATYYFARKSFPVAKGTLEREFGIGTAGLAVIDTGYLATYAVGQFAGGWLGDRIGSRRLVGFGMIASAMFITGFGASSSASLFALFFGLNGFVQATGWPGNIKAMAAWYGPAERGKVMGLWSTCFQVGPLVATALAAFLLKYYGWRASFFVPAVWVALVGLLILLFLQEGPLDTREKPKPGAVHGATREALRNPIVWLLGAAYFGMKLIRYCLDFWLPYYLEKSLGYERSTAAYVSTSFQFGGIFGAIAVGWVSDRLFPGRRGAVAAICTICLAGSLALYGQVAHLGLGINFAVMALVGFCLFGPDALISGVAAQDLGGPLAAATIAGFINGCGSVGAIAQGALVAGVSKRFGWQAVFQALMLLAAASALTLGAVARLQRAKPVVPVKPV